MVSAGLSRADGGNNDCLKDDDNEVDNRQAHSAARRLPLPGKGELLTRQAALKEHDCPSPRARNKETNKTTPPNGTQNPQSTPLKTKMGCIICLDDFRDDDPSMRPSCLPCGHVYHHSCLTAWLKSRPPPLRRCPTCTQPAVLERIVTLWPADIADLDRLAAERKQPEFYERAAVVGMSEGESDLLFDLLVDFKDCVQKYVTGVHGAQVVPTRVAGQKILKMMRVEEERSILTDDLKCAIEKLSGAVESFDRRNVRIDLREHRLKEATKTWTEYSKKLNESAISLSAKQDKLRQWDSKLSVERAALAEKTQSLEKERAALKVLQEQLHAGREAVQKDRIELRQLTAQVQAEFSIREGAMQTRMDTTEAQMLEADKERNDTREQNHKLANQLRELQKRIKEAQIAKDQDKAKRAGLRDEIVRLELENKKLRAAALTTATTPKTNGAVSSPRQRQQVNSPSASQSSNDARKCTSGGGSANRSVDSSLSILPPKHHRANPSAAYQAINDSDTDDDADDDDFGYPMPGLPPSKYQRQSSQRLMIDLTNASSDSLSATEHDVSNNKRLQPAASPAPSLARNGGSGVVSPPASASSPSTTTSSASSVFSNAAALTADALAKTRGVVTGQKRKVRA